MHYVWQFGFFIDLGPPIRQWEVDMKALCFLVVTIFLSMSGCMSAPVTGDNPFKTPDRGYGSGLSAEQRAELLKLMQPCVDFARDSFPQAADRFFSNPPKGAIFFTTTRAAGPTEQFYVRVDSFRDGQVYGRMDSAVFAKGRYYNRGDLYSLPVSEVVDWVIYYPDRPEEGNLLGKYLLRRKDGLISGQCNPKDSELTSLRVYREGYSFIPPDIQGWRVYGVQADLGTDFTMQRENSGTGVLDTVFTMRVQMPKGKVDRDNFPGYVMSIEKENLGDPNRYKLLAHDVTPFAHGEQQCVLSQQLIEDSSALLSSGVRRPMTREIRSLVCMRPYNSSTAVVLTYVHRYPEGQRDEGYTRDADNMFNSLSFF